MSDDLVQRLRQCWDGATDIHYAQEHELIKEAADRIEALERDCWKMHEADNKRMAALETHILALEAALREMDDCIDGWVRDIARRALEGKP